MCVCVYAFLKLNSYETNAVLKTKETQLTAVK